MEKEYSATRTSISNLLPVLYRHCWAYDDHCPNFINRKNPAIKDLNGTLSPWNMIVSSWGHFVQGVQASWRYRNWHRCLLPCFSVLATALNWIICCSPHCNAIDSIFCSLCCEHSTCTLLLPFAVVVLCTINTRHKNGHSMQIQKGRILFILIS